MISAVKQKKMQKATYFKGMIFFQPVNMYPVELLSSFTFTVPFENFLQN